MNKILFVFLSLNLCACTSYYPITPESGDIRTEVRAGTVVKIGDRVRLHTGDTEKHDLTITQLTDDAIVGEDGSVNIDDLLEIHIRKVSAVKTTALVVSIVILVGSYYTAKGLEDAFANLFTPSM